MGAGANKSKKSPPVYILLTAEERNLILNTLRNVSLNFLSGGVNSERGSLGSGASAATQIMMLMRLQASLTTTMGGGVDKPIWRLPMAGARQGQEALLTSLILLPLSENLRQVNNMVQRLEQQVECYKRAFDQVQSQLERIQGMMGRVLDVVEPMQTEKPTEQEYGVRDETREGKEVTQVRCDCGRMISVTNVEEKMRETEEAQDLPERSNL